MNLIFFFSYYWLLNFYPKKFDHLLLNRCDYCFCPWEYKAAVWVVTRWCTTPRLAACFRSYWTVVVLVFEIITRRNLSPFRLRYSIWAWKGIYFKLYKSTLSLCKSSSDFSWYSNEIFELIVALGSFFNNILPLYFKFWLLYFLNYIALCNIIVTWTLTPTT